MTLKQIDMMAVHKIGIESALTERDLLRRQVEVLLRHIIAESPNAGVCHMGQPQCYGCLGVGDCKDESACGKRLRDWSLEQAKKGEVSMTEEERNISNDEKNYATRENAEQASRSGLHWTHS